MRFVTLHLRGYRRIEDTCLPASAGNILRIGVGLIPGMEQGTLEMKTKRRYEVSEKVTNEAASLPQIQNKLGRAYIHIDIHTHIQTYIHNIHTYIYVYRNARCE